MKDKEFLSVKMHNKNKKTELTDEICIKLLRLLENPDNWMCSRDNCIRHRVDNVELNTVWLLTPSKLKFPFRYRKIGHLVRNIVKFRQMTEENIKLTFILEYLTGMYPKYFELPPNGSSSSFEKTPEIKAWLENDVGEENYKIIGLVVYLCRQEDYAYYVLKWL